MYIFLCVCACSLNDNKLREWHLLVEKLPDFISCDRFVKVDRWLNIQKDLSKISSQHLGDMNIMLRYCTFLIIYLTSCMIIDLSLLERRCHQKKNIFALPINWLLEMSGHIWGYRFSYGAIWCAHCGWSHEAGQGSCWLY